MFIEKMALPRRTFLRGLGVTLALPLLDAMVPAATVLAATPAAGVKRTAFIYLPHGFIMDNWTPDSVGTGYEMKRIMKPLEKWRDRMVVVSGMDGAPNGGQGGHATGPASYLTDVSPKQTEGNDIFAGTSVDQMLAKKLGQETAFPSLEVATEDFTNFVGACEIGYSCAYLNTISWSSPTTPLPMEINPRVMFERMFGGTGTADERRVERDTDKSILDAITSESKRLQIGLGAKDRARLGEYMDNIREIERRIQKVEAQNTSAIKAPTAPIGIPEDFGEHCSLIFDLLTVAYQADLTRVTSFMMARDLHSRAYPEIGADEGHHSLSHHGNNPTKVAKFVSVNTYHVGLFSTFLDRLQNTQDGDGTLLDHSRIVFGSGMSTGNVHSHIALPFVVAGAVNGGRHLMQPRETPHGNLLLTVAQWQGLEIDKFGLSNGTVDL